MNRDKKVDFIIANIGSDNIGIFLNIGNGHFADQNTYSTNAKPFAVVISDINGDNQPDIIVGHRQSVSIINNDCLQ
jgi:hypothetical protein